MISIVCPFYNEEKILQQSVQEMIGNFKELPGAWELIIVNDGSTDNTKSILNNMSGIELINISENSGKANSLKVGINYLTALIEYPIGFGISHGK